MADYIYMMESRLTPEQQRGVTLVQEVARAHEMNIYLVGGVVRDIISGAMIRDLDFAVQGNPLKLQRDLEKAGAVVEGVDEPYKTLYLLLPGNLRGEIAAARSEKYDKPGKPPEMTPSTINEDVRRRDFTVNAMALSLNPGSRGLLLDPFNGVADIEAKLLRVLHNYAFLEDPSRLLRATRFMARLDWQLEERTQARFDAAKENNYIEHASKRNLGHEIEQIAHEMDPLKILKALEKEGWLKELNPHWSTSKVDTSGLNHLLKVRQQMMDLNYTLDSGPSIMHFLTAKLNSHDVSALQSMVPRRGFVNAWKHVEEDAKSLVKRLMSKEANTASQTWKLLSGEKPERILFAAATGMNAQATRKINDFFGKWRQVRARFPLPEMAELRITTDLPEYPKIADELFLQLIDNKVKTAEEIKKFLAPYSPPEPPPPPPPVRRGRAAKKAVPSAKQKAVPAEQAAPEGALAQAVVAVGKAAGKLVKAAKSALGVEPALPSTAKTVMGKGAASKAVVSKPADAIKKPLVARKVTGKAPKAKAKPSSKAAKAKKPVKAKQAKKSAKKPAKRR